MKYVKYGLVSIMMLLLTGCNFFKMDTMEGINIYTTTYPINYLISYLYGDNSTIYSIYPTDVSVDEFELSDKKIEEYSKSNLFVFNSLDKDKDRSYAVAMINKNKRLKVIDAGVGMNYNYDISELWLNPYNYLMMAQNVKDGLLEYITNPYLISNRNETGINDKYEKLKYDLSNLDATLKENINNANYKIIVADNDLFKFLEKYNLKVISLEENDDLTENTIDNVKKLINEGKIKYIYSTNESSNETVNNLITNYKLELLTINSMQSVDGGVTNSNENYLTIMHNNIELLNKELYK